MALEKVNDQDLCDMPFAPHHFVLIFGCFVVTLPPSITLSTFFTIAVLPLGLDVSKCCLGSHLHKSFDKVIYCRGLIAEEEALRHLEAQTSSEDS